MSYQVINLVSYLEGYIEEKIKTALHPDIDHENLNRKRTMLVDYIDSLQDKGSED